MSSPNTISALRLTDAQKKANHIQSEQKRREAIREGFDDLATLVPGMEGQGRSEAVVLQATVEYLREQLERKDELKREAVRQGYTDEEVEKMYKKQSNKLLRTQQVVEPMFGNNRMMPPTICGCFYNGDNGVRQYLPQVKLDSHTTISPLCFTTKLTQTFSNSNAYQVKQVRYAFPLYDGVAVNGYTISFADTILRGTVKQKDDARQTYQAAVDRGETAGLLESLPAGIFGVTLGNVPAKTDIIVEITYCGELKHDAGIDGLRYVLPTSIAPRYGHYPGEVLQRNAQAKEGMTITVDMDMTSSAIRKVQSPSHPIAVSMGAVSNAIDTKAFQPSHASATLTLGSAELAEDFVLQLLVDDINNPRAIIETHPTLPNQRAIMATLVPRFTLEPAYPEIVFIADQSGSMSGTKNDALVKALNVFLKSLPIGVRFNICAFGNSFKFLWPKSQAYTEANVKKAVDFVNTFSAAYGGTEILKPITAAFEQHLSDLPLEIMLLTDGQIWAEQAVFAYINEQVHDKKVDARVFALGVGGDVSHTLVEGVARAGNGFVQFVTQNEETDQKVVRMLKGALYAHTKDYRLEVKYAEDQKGGDSEVAENEDDDFELIESVEACLVIGEKPPAYAQTETAEPAKEKAPTSFFDESVDVDKPTKDEQQPANRYAHLPVIDTPKLLQAPSEIPPLFPSNRTTVYLLLGPDTAQREIESVILRAKTAQGTPLELVIAVDEVANPDVPAVHQLAARKAIQDLEEGRGWLQSATVKSQDESLLVKKKHESRFDEIVEREAVRLGEKFQVASRWTSFVAVQDGPGTSQVEGPDGSVTKDSLAHLGQEVDRLRTQVATPGESLNAMSASVDSANVQLDTGISSARKQRKFSPFGLIGAGASLFGSRSAVYAAPPPPPPTRGVARQLATPHYSMSSAASSGGGMFGASAARSSTARSPAAPPSRRQAPQLQAPHALSSSGHAGVNDLMDVQVEQSSAGGFFGSRGMTSSYSAPYDPTIEDDEARFPQEDYSASTMGTPSSGVFGSSGARPLRAASRQMGVASQPTAAAFGSMRAAPPAPTYGAAASAPPPPPSRRSSGGLFGGFRRRSIDRSAGGAASASFSAYSPRAPPVQAPPRRTDYTAIMHELIALQSFSGAWRWHSGLFGALGLSETACCSWGLPWGELGDDIKATALVVAFLELHLASQRNVWEMVATKAVAWLTGEVGVSEGQKAVEEGKRVIAGVEGTTL